VFLQLEKDGKIARREEILGWENVEAPAEPDV
jgi:hypothetical protein